MKTIVHVVAVSVLVDSTTMATTVAVGLAVVSTWIDEGGIAAPF